MKDEKLQAMEEGGQILAAVLEELKEKAKSGIETKKLDDAARRLCLKHHVRPSFLNYEGYPASLCVSINDEVVHGLPGKRLLKEGDIVSLDMGIYHAGYHTDAAISFGLGEIGARKKKLLEVTEKALYFGIDEARSGHRIGDISSEIQSYVEENGFNVVRMLVGHGIGKKLHEEPLVPNFGQRGTGPMLSEGITLAIEPMVTAGKYEVHLDKDNWTYKTDDGSDVAHFEHTVYISANGPVVLTA